MLNENLTLEQLREELDIVSRMREESKIKMNTVSEDLCKEIESIFIKHGNLNDYGFGCDVSVSYCPWMNYFTEVTRLFRVNLGCYTNPNGKESKFRYMFHSTFELEVDTNFDISLNCGTSGNYDKKNNPEQVSRAFIIANIWKNSDAISEEISNIKLLEEYKRCESEYYELDREFNALKQKATVLERDAVIDSLCVDDTYVVNMDSCNQYLNPFTSNQVGYSHKAIISTTITKITDKYVWFKIKYKTYSGDVVETNEDVKLKKVDFINSIVNKLMLIEKKVNK